MADIKFIVLKINGIDISEMPHSDAVQMFLKASEPMNLEVRRPISDDLNKFHISNGYFSPFTCVISPSLTLSPPSTSPQQQYSPKVDNFESKNENKLPLDDEAGNGGGDDVAEDIVKDSPTSGTVTGSPSSGSIGEKSFVSTGIQTDTIIAEYIFSDASVDDQSNEHIFEEGLPPEIDIEEVTLQKSASHEKLGLTVSYSSGSDDTDTCTEVYISDIIPNSVAARDGRLRQGDQILQVNGRDVSGKEDTETLIAENKNAVTFLVSRYLYIDDDLHTSYDDYDNDIAQQTYQNCLSPTKVRNNGFSIIGDLRSSSEQTNSNTSRSSSSHKSNIEATEIGGVNAKDNKAKIAIDPLDHVNIEAHLESVNQELAQLTSRMENSMMLHNSISGHSWKYNKATSSSAIMASSSLPKVGQNLNIYRTPIDNVAKSTSSTIADNPLDTKPPKTTPTVSTRKLTNPRSNCNKKPIESDTEHIYETIPEDIESEPFYCLPYEAIEQNLVEQWLEMQHCQQQILLRQQQLNDVETPAKTPGNRGGSKKDRSGLLLQQIKAISNNMRFQPSSSSKTMKSNSSGEDHENSSSAYNTGGSCNSNNHLAPEMNSNEEGGGVCDKTGYQRATAALHIPPGSQPSVQQQCPDDCAGTYIQDINDNCEECQRQKKDKVSSSPKHELAQQKSPQKLQRLLASKQQCPLAIPIIHSALQQRVADQTLAKSPEISADTMYTNMANLKRTMLLQQKLFRQTLIRQNAALGQASHASVAEGAKISPPTDRLPFNAPNLSQYHFVSSQEVSAIQTKQTTCEEPPMVWKVKRRQDGTRYIVRRPARNRILRERAIRLTTERNDQTTEDDTISEIKTGRYWTREERKKHIERAKERRQRQQQQQLSFNRCENADNTLPSSALATATIGRKQQGRIIGGQQSLISTPGATSQNRCPTLTTVQTLDCPITHKKSLKKKKKDENPTTVVGESNNKMVGLLSVTTV